MTWLKDWPTVQRRKTAELRLAYECSTSMAFDLISTPLRHLARNPPPYRATGPSRPVTATAESAKETGRKPRGRLEMDARIEDGYLPQLLTT